MPERRQVRVSRSLEGGGERPATERGQPLTGTLPTPTVTSRYTHYSTSEHDAFTTASILSSESPPFAKAWLAFTLPSL